MNTLHGRYEELCCVLWVHEHFISDGYGFNFHGEVVAKDVGLDPRVSEGLFRGGGEKLFWYGNHHLHS